LETIPYAVNVIALTPVISPQYDGTFVPNWDVSSDDPLLLRFIEQNKQDVPDRIYVACVATWTHEFRMQASSREVWVDNAVASFVQMFEDYGLHGIEINYERGTQHADWRYCIGELLKRMKAIDPTYYLTVSPYGNKEENGGRCRGPFCNYLNMYNDGYGQYIDVILWQAYTWGLNSVAQYEYYFSYYVGRAQYFPPEKMALGMASWGKGLDAWRTPDNIFDVVNALKVLPDMQVNGESYFRHCFDWTGEQSWPSQPTMCTETNFGAMLGLSHPSTYVPCFKSGRVLPFFEVESDNLEIEVYEDSATDGLVGTSGGLVHFYNFKPTLEDTSLVNDGAGAAHGTLMNGASVVSNDGDSYVQLDGSNDYVQLPLDAMSYTLRRLREYTITITVELDPGTVSQNWVRLFDFSADDKADKMFLTTRRSDTQKLSFSVTNNDVQSTQAASVITDALLASGVKYFIAVTSWGGGTTVRIFRADEADAPFVVATLNAEVPRSFWWTRNVDHAYLGKSAYSDPYFGGKIFEFAIYEGMVLYPQLQALAAVSLSSEGDAYQLPPIAPSKNVALYKSASQSTTSQWDHAQSAAVGVDGEPTYATTIFHTAYGLSWWEVELVPPAFGAYVVSSVTLFNRNSCCQYRLPPFDLEFLDADRNVLDTVSVSTSANYYNFNFDNTGETIPLSGGNDGSATNLQACVGECDSDSQCALGLKCFQRSNGEAIPGCSGAGSATDWDYCYYPGAVENVNYVRVALTNNDYLHFREMEVYGYTAATTANDDAAALPPPLAYRISNWATNIQTEGGTLRIFKTIALTDSDDTSIFDPRCPPTVDSAGALSFCLAPDNFGETYLRVVLVDDNGTPDDPSDDPESEPQFVLITVLRTNDLPSFAVNPSFGSVVTVEEDFGAAAFAQWATDISRGPDNEAYQDINFIVESIDLSGGAAGRQVCTRLASYTGDCSALYSTLSASEVVVIAAGATSLSPAPCAASDNIPVSTDAGDIIMACGTCFLVTVRTSGETCASLASLYAVEVSALQEVNGSPSNCATDAATAINMNDDVQVCNLPVLSRVPRVSDDGSLVIFSMDEASGSQSFTIVAMDTDIYVDPVQTGLSTPHNVTVAVDATNDPPSFTPGPHQTVIIPASLSAEDPGSEGTFDISLVDWAGDVCAGPNDEMGQGVRFDVTVLLGNEVFSGQGSEPELKIDMSQPPAPPAVDDGSLFPRLCWKASLSFVLDNMHGISTGSEVVIQMVATDDGGTPGTGDDAIADDLSSEPHVLILRFVVDGDDSSGEAALNPSAQEDEGDIVIAGWVSSALNDPAMLAWIAENAANNVVFPLVVTRSVSNRCFEYTVASGDSCGSLARRFTNDYDATVDSLLSHVLHQTTVVDGDGEQRLQSCVDAPGVALGEQLLICGTCEEHVVTADVIAALGLVTMSDVCEHVATTTGFEPEDVLSSDGMACDTSVLPLDKPSVSVTLCGSYLFDSRDESGGVPPSLDSGGRLRFTSSAHQNGALTFTIRPTASETGEEYPGDVPSFDITVAPVNDPPSFSVRSTSTDPEADYDGRNLGVFEDAGPVVFEGWAANIQGGPAMSRTTDEKGQALEFVVAAVEYSVILDGGPVPGTPEAFFDTLPAVDPRTGDLTFQVAENVNGKVTLEVLLADTPYLYLDGPANDNSYDSCLGGAPTDAHSLEEATAICDASAACGWLHNAGCDGSAWRVCGSTTDLSAASNTNPLVACTKMKPGRGGTTGAQTTAAATVVLNVFAVNDAPSITDTAGEVTVLEQDESIAVTVPNWVVASQAGPLPSEGVGTPSSALSYHVTHATGYQNGCFDYSVRPADGCSMLAYRFLGSWARSSEIMRKSDGAPCGADIAVGEVLRICGDCFEHVSKGGESCSSLTLQYHVERDDIRLRDNNACTDPFYEGESLTVCGIPLLSTLPVVAADGAVTFTPRPNATGTVVYDLVVRDNHPTSPLESAPVPLTITVLPVNDDPSFHMHAFCNGTDIASIVVPEDAGAVSLATFASDIRAGPVDETEQVLEFRVEFRDGRAAQDGQAPLLASVSVDLEGFLHLTPSPDNHGWATYDVILVDNLGGNSEAWGLNVTVLPVNDLPSFDLAATTLAFSEDDNAVTSVEHFISGVSTGPADEDGNEEYSFRTSVEYGFQTFCGLHTVVPGDSCSSIAHLYFRDYGAKYLEQVKFTAPASGNVNIDSINDDFEDDQRALPTEVTCGTSNAPSIFVDQQLAVCSACKVRPIRETGGRVCADIASEEGVSLSEVFVFDTLQTTVSCASLLTDGNGGDADNSVLFAEGDNALVCNVPLYTHLVSDDELSLEIRVHDGANGNSKLRIELDDDAGRNSPNTPAVVEATIDELCLPPYLEFEADVNPDEYCPEEGCPDPYAATSPASVQFVTINVTAANSLPSFAVNVNVASPDNTTVTMVGTTTVVDLDEDVGYVSILDWASDIRPGPYSDELFQRLRFVVTPVATTDSDVAFKAHLPYVDTLGALRFESAPDANGPANFQIRLEDEEGALSAFAPGTYLTINVAPVDDPPRWAVLESVSWNETASGDGESEQGFVPDFGFGIAAGGPEEFFAGDPEVTIDVTKNSPNTCFFHTVRFRDTCATLARRFLGTYDVASLDPRSMQVVASADSFARDYTPCDGSTLQTGTVVLLCGPCREHVVSAVTGPQSCAEVAAQEGVPLESISFVDLTVCSDNPTDAIPVGTSLAICNAPDHRPFPPSGGDVIAYDGDVVELVHDISFTFDAAVDTAGRLDFAVQPHQTGSVEMALTLCEPVAGASSLCSAPLTSRVTVAPSNDPPLFTMRDETEEVQARVAKQPGVFTVAVEGAVINVAPGPRDELYQDVRFDVVVLEGEMALAATAAGSHSAAGNVYIDNLGTLHLTLNGSAPVLMDSFSSHPVLLRLTAADDGGTPLDLLDDQSASHTAAGAEATFKLLVIETAAPTLSPTVSTATPTSVPTVYEGGWCATVPLEYRPGPAACYVCSVRPFRPCDNGRECILLSRGEADIPYCNPRTHCGDATAESACAAVNVNGTDVVDGGDGDVVVPNDDDGDGGSGDGNPDAALPNPPGGSDHVGAVALGVGVAFACVSVLGAFYYHKEVKRRRDLDDRKDIDVELDKDEVFSSTGERIGRKQTMRSRMARQSQVAFASLFPAPNFNAGMGQTTSAKNVEMNPLFNANQQGRTKSGKTMNPMLNTSSPTSASALGTRVGSIVNRPDPELGASSEGGIDIDMPGDMEDSNLTRHVVYDHCI
jgi:hypothetical protein